MSITSDIRTYADTALDQGKQVVGQAQAQLTDVTGKATAVATGAVNDLRAQAEKAVNLDAIRTAVEPYLAQAKQYRSSVTDRAEGLFDSVRSDKRVARVVATAESLTGVVVDTVTQRVVKPVATLTGRSPKTVSKPTTTSKVSTQRSTAKKAPAKAATKPATTRPAAKKAPAKKSTSTTTARKAPAKKATSSN
jgi:uncharacterized protein YjbJ (UPF0337 family)